METDGTVERDGALTLQGGTIRNAGAIDVQQIAVLTLIDDGGSVLNFGTISMRCASRPRRSPRP